MKLTDTPTGVIICKAITNSEWDNCDYALITLDRDFIASIYEDYKALKAKYKGECIQITVLQDNADFFYQDEDTDPQVINDFLKSTDEWSYIEIDDSEIETLHRPEQDIRYGKTKISSSVQFVAYGKHTNEEFWMEDIPIECLFENKKEVSDAGV